MAAKLYQAPLVTSPTLPTLRCPTLPSLVEEDHPAPSPVITSRNCPVSSSNTNTSGTTVSCPFA